MAYTLQEKTEIAKKACTIIFANEGGYTSINKNDNGAVSIGKMQWHGNRALSLLKTIVTANKSQANQLLGSSLYNEIISSNNWGTRIFNDSESTKTKQLLATSQSKTAQDNLSVTDVLSYINKGISYGLSDEKSLIYLADGLNQYGTASTLWKRITQEAIKKGGTLQAMYEATKANTSNYLTRRTKVYNALKDNDSTDSSDTYTKTAIDKTTVKMIQTWINTYCNAGLTVDGSFGPKSKKGIIKALQHCINEDYPSASTPLVEDGIFGVKSQRACPYVSTTHYNKSNLAFIAQCLLYVNGYDPQGLDSSFGPNSRKAAIQFQKDHGLTADGEVGKLTFAKLVV